MKPSAISLFAAEGFLAVDAIVYAAMGHKLISAAWVVAMYLAWRLYKWSSQ